MEQFDLKYPYTNGEGVIVDCLNLRRPTVGDLELMEGENAKGTFYRSKRLVELVAGLPPKEVCLLDVADWDAVNDKVMTFFPSDPEPSDEKRSEK